MSDHGFLSAILTQIPSTLVTLAGLIFCIYFLTKKATAPIVLLLLGFVFHLCTTLSWAFVMFQISKGNHDVTEWFGVAQTILGGVGHLMQVLGIILLLFNNDSLRTRLGLR